VTSPDYKINVKVVSRYIALGHDTYRESPYRYCIDISPYRLIPSSYTGGSTDGCGNIRCPTFTLFGGRSQYAPGMWLQSPLSVYIKLKKGKSLRKHSLHEKTAASVLLKPFISSNDPLLNFCVSIKLVWICVKLGFLCQVIVPDTRLM